MIARPAGAKTKAKTGFICNQRVCLCGACIDAQVVVCHEPRLPILFLEELWQVGPVGFEQIIQYFLDLIGGRTKRVGQERLVRGLAIAAHRGLNSEQLERLNLRDQSKARHG